jgi:hypothetical protein
MFRRRSATQTITWGEPAPEHEFIEGTATGAGDLTMAAPTRGSIVSSLSDSNGSLHAVAGYIPTGTTLKTPSKPPAGSRPNTAASSAKPARGVLRPQTSSAIGAAPAQARRARAIRPSLLPEAQRPAPPRHQRRPGRRLSLPSRGRPRQRGSGDRPGRLAGHRILFRPLGALQTGNPHQPQRLPRRSHRQTAASKLDDLAPEPNGLDDHIAERRYSLAEARTPSGRPNIWRGTRAPNRSRPCSSRSRCDRGPAASWGRQSCRTKSSATPPRLVKGHRPRRPSHRSPKTP